MQTEIGNIEKSLTTSGKTEDVKNKIKELKSRIYATRGVFSDHNLKSLRSYTNSLKYYVTTGILFRSTRHRYNELENQLSALENFVETISEIVEFNNTLQKYLGENKEGNKDKNLLPSLDDLLGNDGKGESLYIGFTKALSDIKRLETNKSLEKFAQECRNKMC